jgi:hypothetical protein
MSSSKSDPHFPDHHREQELQPGKVNRLKKRTLFYCPLYLHPFLSRHYQCSGQRQPAPREILEILAGIRNKAVSASVTTSK